MNGDTRLTRRASLLRLGGVLGAAIGGGAWKASESTRNAQDAIYRNGGKRSQLSIRRSTSAYVATITMGVNR